MSSHKHCLGVLLAWCALHDPATAQVERAELAALTALQPNNPPVAGVVTEEADARAWRVISFYAVTQPDAPIVAGRPSRTYVARRVDGVGDAVGEERWADESSCPTLRGALAWMANLPMPRPHLMGLTPDASESSGGQPANAPTEARGVRISMAARQEDNSVATVQALVYGGPIGAWFDRTSANLEPCWSDEKPGG